MYVSIIITNYNYGKYLTRSIQSALNQYYEFKDLFEVIVIDDFSTDNSRVIIDNFQNDLKIIYNDKNYGLPYSLNKAIKHSRGMYTIRLDADDWLDRYCVHNLSNFLNSYRKYDYVWPDYNLYDENENFIKTESSPLGAGVMFRKQALINIGLYDEEMHTHEDKDLLIRCGEKFKGYHLKLPLYKYIKHKNNMTNDKERIIVYDKKLANKHKL